ncbi:MAG: winged helix-turn-helix domain-containing protein [Patescibacteria group bacterium]
MLIKIRLTKKQKQQLLQIKHQSKIAIIRDRAQVILALNNGLNIINTAKALSRSDKFVKNAIKLFNQGKIDEIKYSSNNHNLTPNQRDKIIKIINDKAPNELSDFNFKTQFWSTDILKKVIKKKYQIEYKTEKSYYDLFKVAGFSFHKPKIKDFRQDPEKIKSFKGALKKSSSRTKIRLSW